MRKQMLVAVMIAALPLAALAQGAPGATPAPGPGPGQRPGQAGQRRDPERMEKRMRLARTLGLAEALDLDAPQALKLGETIAKFDERRRTLHNQMRDAREVLRRAAQGEKVAPAEVDQAIQKALEARAQMQAVDRDTIAAVTKDLTPEKKARAVLFLSKFHRRFAGHGQGMGPGMGPGMMDHGGMGPGGRGGPGRGGRDGWGMGPDAGPGPGPMMGMGPPGPNGWDDDVDD